MLLWIIFRLERSFILISNVTYYLWEYGIEFLIKKFSHFETRAFLSILCVVQIIMTLKLATQHFSACIVLRQL